MRIVIAHWRKMLAAATVAGAMSAPATAAPEHYKIDPTHTFPSIAFDHMGISVWRGKFTSTRGAIVLDREARTGSVDIAIDPASIQFGLDAMDEKARSNDWFDVEQYPDARYQGTVIFSDGRPSTVEGTLTFRGVERDVPLTIRHFKCIPHPMLKVEVCGADATGTLNWSEFGMAYSEYGKGEAGRTRLDIQVEAIKQQEE